MNKSMSFKQALPTACLLYTLIYPDLSRQMTTYLTLWLFIVLSGTIPDLYGQPN